MRIKPQYNFEQYCKAGSPLKGEKHSHQFKGKVKRYATGSKVPSHHIGGDPVIRNDVHCGSSKRTEKEAMEMLGKALIKAGL